jgi:hypothetical protein
MTGHMGCSECRLGGWEDGRKVYRTTTHRDSAFGTRAGATRGCKTQRGAPGDCDGMAMSGK